MQSALNESQMYKALIDRDTSFEGIFVAGIKTTGIFCRPTCRARKPKRINVEFFSTVNEALHRGYRPCKVCRPMVPANAAPDWIKTLLSQINDKSGFRLNDAAIRKLGLDPNRVRRWFKSQYQMTFQGYLRSLRVGEAFGRINKGGRVVDAAFENGYESLSGFSTAFKKLTGKAPSSLRGGEIIKTYQIPTPLGPMLAGSVNRGICLLEFTDRRSLENELIDLQRRLKSPIVTSESNHIKQLSQELEEYFAGRRQKFEVPLFTPGSDFQKKVWGVLREIPYGETRSYKKQAVAVGNQNAVRAVARANGQNKISIVIPCHRVIGSDGSLTGYGGGLERKRFLLKLEGAGDFR